MEGPQKVRVLNGLFNVSQEVPEHQVKFMKSLFMFVVGWWFISLLVSMIQTFAGSGAQVGVFFWIGLILSIAIGASCCFCFVEGINGQNKLLMRVFSIANAVGFFCTILGVVMAVMGSATTFETCDNCIKKNVTDCKTEARGRGAQSQKLDTSKGCDVYLLDEGALAFQILGGVISCMISIAGFKISESYNTFFQKKIAPFGQQGFVGVQPTVVQPGIIVSGQPTVVSGQPMIVQSGQPIAISGQPMIVQSGQPIVVNQGSTTQYTRPSGTITVVNNNQPQQNVQMEENGGYVMPTIQTNTGINSNVITTNSTTSIQQPPPPPPPTKTNV